jgi:hypothetical protein
MIDNRLAAAEQPLQGMKTKPENSRVRFEAKLLRRRMQAKSPRTSSRTLASYFTSLP